MTDDIEMLRNYIMEMAQDEDEEDKALAALERVAAERDEWRLRAQHYQRERAELADKLNGEPCAEIRWQYERDALREKLRMAQEALKFYAERMTYVSRSGMECGITRDNFGDNARAMIAEIEKGLK